MSFMPAASSRWSAGGAGPVGGAGRGVGGGDGLDSGRGQRGAGGGGGRGQSVCGRPVQHDRGVGRNYVAALDAVSGQVTTWHPEADNTVWALWVAENSVYVGGQFTSLGGLPRRRLAQVEAATGAVLPWNPQASERVFALALAGNTVYAGGRFQSVGAGASFPGGAGCGERHGYAVGPRGEWGGPCLAGVREHGVCGGAFTQVGARVRNFLAALDAGSGLAMAWNPDADDYVYALALGGRAVCGRGVYDGGASRGSAWRGGDSRRSGDDVESGANDTVFALEMAGASVLAGGDFTFIGGGARNKIAALDLSGEGVAGVESGRGRAGQCLAHGGQHGLCGGFFREHRGRAWARLAALDALGTRRSGMRGGGRDGGQQQRQCAGDVWGGGLCGRSFNQAGARRGPTWPG